MNDPSFLILISTSACSSWTSIVMERVRASVFGSVIEQLRKRHLQQLLVGPYRAALRSGLKMMTGCTPSSCEDAATLSWMSRVRSEYCSRFNLRSALSILAVRSRRVVRSLSRSACFIDQDDKPLFRAGQGIHLNQAGT